MTGAGLLLLGSSMLLLWAWFTDRENYAALGCAFMIGLAGLDLMFTGLNLWYLRRQARKDRR